ncbi:DivIVA domain-containing protein [Micropruina sp.]|uniref:DivIVA domain-containing protein n=1 Tax=Micropruina sp. TaxID=2737536 RepID=UPI00261F0C64|nr:DivIVA domain-containing protein [Micropruina sp.]
MSQQPEETVGLDLFDETASAAGSFPHSMLGYERQAVDAYIRDIERQLSSAKRKVRSLQRQLSTKAEETDYSRLGAHTGDMLRAAEAQAAEMVKAAQVEAQKIVDDATKEAGQVTREAHEGAAQARVSGLDDLNRLRDELAGQTSAELAGAQEQARSLREAAENHRAMVIADAERNAAAMHEQAALEAERLRQDAEREAAEVRAALAKEHSEALAALQQRQDQVTATLSELADRARRQSEDFGAKLAADSELMDQRRQKALAEADQIVVEANEQGRAILSEARAKAAKLIADAELAASARAEHLRRETERLQQRKQAIVAQLTSLSSLANSSVAEFPDLGNPDSPTIELAAALDDTKVEKAVAADDDATRVQPAAAGGGGKRR